MTQRVYIGLHETERIQLGRLRWHEFPATSSAELYDQLTAWLSSIVTKTKVPVRRAVRGSKHRDLLCVSADNGHAVKFARHVFVSSDQKRETWRCDECGHETTIPAASFPKEPGTEAT
ncbi:MAG: hypothetical protein E6J20_17200 [Chloroflexi bacterium]|nr:MAG: hypothetical protein E6J20_17200 [Chloroflexota bacterium]